VPYPSADPDPSKEAENQDEQQSKNLSRRQPSREHLGNGLHKTDQRFHLFEQQQCSEVNRSDDEEPGNQRAYHKFAIGAHGKASERMDNFSEQHKPRLSVLVSLEIR
jgi:hypothetical protein